MLEVLRVVVRPALLQELCELICLLGIRLVVIPQHHPALVDGLLAAGLADDLPHLRHVLVDLAEQLGQVRLTLFVDEQQHCRLEDVGPEDIQKGLQALLELCHPFYEGKHQQKCIYFTLYIILSHNGLGQLLLNLAFGHASVTQAHRIEYDVFLVCTFFDLDCAR